MSLHREETEFKSEDLTRPREGKEEFSTFVKVDKSTISVTTICNDFIICVIYLDTKCNDYV
jgi:hypothetical protein